MPHFSPSLNRALSCFDVSVTHQSFGLLVDIIDAFTIGSFNSPVRGAYDRPQRRPGGFEYPCKLTF
jgi:hypothetical protein